MTRQLFIPKKIKVGFQQRTDTFTHKLGYVIPLGENGEYRKMTSWSSWRDAKLGEAEFENSANAHFVLNKGVQRYGYWRGSGRSVVRVYDTRGFEFEITVENLLFLLMHSDVSKRDVVQECVYAWEKDKLILLPTNSKEYEDAVSHTDKQYVKVSTKTLVEGAMYFGKKHDRTLTYVGFREVFAFESDYDSDGRYRKSTTQRSKGKKHVFWDGYEFVWPSASTLGGRIGDEITDQYAELLEKFYGCNIGTKVVGLTIIPYEDRTTTVAEMGGNSKQFTIQAENGVFYSESCYHYGHQRDKGLTIHINPHSGLLPKVDDLTGNFVIEETHVASSLPHSYRYYDRPPAKTRFLKVIPPTSTLAELDGTGVGRLHYVLQNGKVQEARI